jgi:hypothetical protein
MQIHAADGLQWVFHARSVDPGYYAPFGAFFSESGREGEKGYYLGVKIQLPSKLTVTAYADHFQYVWLRHNLNRPGSGYDYLIQANKTLREGTIYVRFRHVARPGNLSDGNQIYQTALNTRTTVRGHGTFRISDNLNLQFRTEYVHFISPNQRQTGFLSFAGIQYDLNKNIHVKCRYTIFDTQNFATAIWAFEDDVPYGYAIPAFYGQGNRWYVVASIRCWKSAEVWIKFAETTYPVITSVGSGPDSFSGNKRNEIRIVLKATF